MTHICLKKTSTEVSGGCKLLLAVHPKSQLRGSTLDHSKLFKDYFCWSPAADKAFGTLKAHFTSVQILQFSGVGGRFWRLIRELGMSCPKLHPCAFFSTCHSPVERNYDIENWELLANLQEEWCDCLEGTEVPFQVWINHKNLKNINVQSMFQWACGLQPPIFLFQEKEASFHAAQTFILCFIQTSS